MIEVLCVGLGGFVGAAARYGMGLLPWAGDFPLVTLAVNFLGSVLIGAVAQMAQTCSVNPNVVLFAKTGLCGGFTTFSTFSLETLSLFERGRYATGCAYVCASVVACVLGVMLGKAAVRLATGR